MLPTAAPRDPSERLRLLEQERKSVDATLKELRRKRRLSEDALRRPPGKRIQKPSASRTARLLAGRGGAEADVRAVHAFGARRFPDRARPAVEPLADEPLRVEVRPAVEPLADEQVRVGALAFGLPQDGRDGTEAEASRARERAASFLREMTLHRWVQGLDEASALAPSSVTVWAHWTGLRMGMDERGGDLPRPMPTSRKHQLQWVRRWRRRWRVRYRSVPAGAGLSRDSLGEKAGREKNEWPSHLLPRRGRQVREKGGGIFGTRPLRKKEKRGPKAGPFSAPPKNPLGPLVFGLRRTGCRDPAVEQFPATSVPRGALDPPNQHG